MKKYVTLKCTTCARTKSVLVDTVHYTPDKCTITLLCEGRLVPEGYSNNGKATSAQPPSGLVNWYARGSTLSTSSDIQQDSLFSLSTGSKKQVIIAIPNEELGAVPSSSVQVKLTMEIEQQTSTAYRQYTYRKSTPFTMINGVEDGAAKKVLRYSPTDTVDVYLNGVKREQGTFYELYDGTASSSVPVNTVKFLSTVTGASNQVDVIVTQSNAVNTVELQFSRAVYDESRVGLGAWEGVNQVSTAAFGDWSLFYLDFSENTTLKTDVKMRFSGLHYRLSETDAWNAINTGCLLLSRTGVFTSIDRYRAGWVSVSALNTNTAYIVVKTVNNERELMVTESSIADVFPLLEVQRYKKHSLLTTNLSGVTTSEELDNQFINGPDA